MGKYPLVSINNIVVYDIAYNRIPAKRYSVRFFFFSFVPLPYLHEPSRGTIIIHVSVRYHNTRTYSLRRGAKKLHSSPKHYANHAQDERRVRVIVFRFFSATLGGGPRDPRKRWRRRIRDDVRLQFRTFLKHVRRTKAVYVIFTRLNRARLISTRRFTDLSSPSLNRRVICETNRLRCLRATCLIRFNGHDERISFC